MFIRAGSLARGEYFYTSIWIFAWVDKFVRLILFTENIHSKSVVITYSIRDFTPLSKLEVEPVFWAGEIFDKIR